MFKRLVPIIAFLALFHTVSVFALETSLSPQAENRARILFKEIKCPVCTGQSLAESESETAIDIKNVIRERIKAGADDKEIKDFLTRRYGDDILLAAPDGLSGYFLKYGAVVALSAAFSVFCLRNLKREQRKRERLFMKNFSENS